MCSSIITLKNGRKLAFRMYGDLMASKGTVLFTHGHLNSRLFEPAWEATQKDTESAGVKVIAVDRPGYGDSTFPGTNVYSYAEWGADINELMKEHLHIDTFSVCGYSSGGPFAMALAAFLPQSVTTCALVSSDGPYAEIAKDPEQKGLIETLYGSTAIDAKYAVQRCRHSADGLIASYGGMARPARKEMCLQDINHAIKQGYGGVSYDMLLETQPWGFQIGDIRCPVHLWHGRKDESVPVIVADYLIKVLQQRLVPKEQDNAEESKDRSNDEQMLTVTLLDTENHSMIRRKWSEILKGIVSREEARSAWKGQADIKAEL